MKKNLFYLFALICSITLFSACSDNDDPEYIQDGEFDGVYLGTLDVDATGIVEVKDIPQKVYITKTGENQIKMELKNFVFQKIELGNIVVERIDVVKRGTSCTFSGSGNLDLAVGECAVTVSGSIEGNKLDMDIAVVAAGALNVKVDFEGTKLAADKSSEAKILTFSFENEYVVAQPVIDDSNKTITFMIADDMPEEELKALVPTFTLSQGATSDKESGVAQDFSKEVTYTITSEDGIVTVTYTVSITGKEKYLSFDEWETIKTQTAGSEEKYQNPSGTYGTSNPGVMTINDMFGSMGATFEYPVIPVDGKNGKAAQIKTLHTSVNIGGMDYNKLFGGLIPYVTAGSLFTGTFKTDMGNPLNSTKFGIPFAGKPVTFSGWYKYTPGTVYYDNKNKEVEGMVDKCSIYAVLYTDSLDTEGNNIPLTGDYKNTEAYIGSSSRIIMKAELADGSAKADWTEFSIPFKLLEGKTYEPTKKYHLAIVCSSSFEGDYYKGAPGSVLTIDDFSVISE